jgi:hypothetical protein
MAMFKLCILLMCCNTLGFTIARSIKPTLSSQTCANTDIYIDRLNKAGKLFFHIYKQTYYPLRL